MDRGPWDLTVLTEPEIAVLSTVLGLLGEPTRLRILVLLCAGERSVSQLVTHLRIPQPTVSHHLGLMRRGGLVTSRREQKSVFYALHGRLSLADGGCELRIGNASGVSIHIGTERAKQAV